MRGLMLSVWLLVPIGMGAYHYGPGVWQQELDEAGDHLALAQKAVQDGQHDKAVERFSKVLESLPKDQVAQSQRIRLEKAKAQMLSQQLPASYDELTTLLEELQADKQADPKVICETQGALASAKYYLTWLMRLEGTSRQEWEPEIESSRQLYRLLAEQATEQGDSTSAQKHQEDLEAAIRLARLDLSQLQALPLPSQCKGCCSGQCQCKCKGKKPGKSMKQGQKKEDARGAGSGPPPDGKGN
jgi:tetratricopeptide (TPR) repeat protein